MTNVIKMSKPIQPAKLAPEQIQQLMRIEELLKNMGCEFRIRAPGGVGFDWIHVKNRDKGILPMSGKDKPKVSAQTELMRKHGIKRGDIKAYLDSQLINFKPGDIRVVPAGKFDFLGAAFNKHISSYACNTFGIGQISVSWDKDEDAFLVHYHGGI